MALQCSIGSIWLVEMRGTRFLKAMAAESRAAKPVGLRYDFIQPIISGHNSLRSCKSRPLPLQDMRLFSHGIVIGPNPSFRNADTMVTAYVCAVQSKHCVTFHHMGCPSKRENRQSGNDAILPGGMHPAPSMCKVSLQVAWPVFVTGRRRYGAET